MEPDARTFHAPPERASAEALSALGLRLATDLVVQAVLDAWDGYLLVLNRERQILAANGRFLHDLGLPGVEAILGKRPGEATGCEHAHDTEAGCGTGPSCVYCGAVNAILECLRTGTIAEGECSLTLGEGPGLASLDLRVRATPHQNDGHVLVLLGLVDDADRKRREALERTFYHDVFNTIMGIQGWSELLAQGGGESVAVANRIGALIARLSDEVRAHQQLLQAENGSLGVRLALVDVPALLGDLETSFTHHAAARGKRLEVHAAPMTVTTDPALLLRVLVNLVKNALEATRVGGVVTARAGREGEELVFRVHNEGVLPPEVAARVFQRSFSTKGPGRGIGTWGSRLLAERYLGGRVFFRSEPDLGTEFGVAVPLATA